jgi:hypothetical protein
VRNARREAKGTSRTCALLAFWKLEQSLAQEQNWRHNEPFDQHERGRDFKTHSPILAKPLAKRPLPLMTRLTSDLLVSSTFIVFLEGIRYACRPIAQLVMG